MARYDRSPTGSGNRSAARCAGRHSCNNPGRGATLPAARPLGYTVTGSPATRRSSATPRGAAPGPANAPPSPPRHTRHRTQPASPPKSRTGGGPAPAQATRSVRRLRGAVPRRRAHGPEHRAFRLPSRRRRRALAASPAQPPARRCPASPSVADSHASSPDRVPAPKRCGRSSPAPALTWCRRPRLPCDASAPKDGTRHSTPPRAMRRRARLRSGVRQRRPSCGLRSPAPPPYRAGPACLPVARRWPTLARRDPGPAVAVPGRSGPG